MTQTCICRLEWFLGHSGSTYWTKKASEKAEIFRKVEPYLTFLNIPQLERQAVHALNNTASQFVTHSTMLEAAGLPVAAAFGFMPGLILGLRKG